MATIRSQMVLNDQVTGVLKNITRALDITLHSFEQMQDASANAVDVRLLNQARASLGEVNLAVREMEENYRRAAQQEQQVTRNIRQSTQAEQQLNASIRGGNDALDDMVGKAKNLAATIGASVGLKKLIELSDQMTSTTARLNFIVDDGGSVEALEAKIMASAQRSRAAYLDTASAIASMGANAGAAFTSNDELIAFMEQVNKQFVIGGASAQGQAAAMLQLTQAMAAGALRGEELNSILENAPGIARAIEQYMGIAEGSIKQYAQEGQVTAEVVKNALFSVADETNAKFESMPMTWTQIWTNMQNRALSALTPILGKLNAIANSEQFDKVVNGALRAFGVIATVGAALLGVLFNVGSAVVDNWSVIEPIIMAAATALGIYYGIVLALNIAQAIQNGLKAQAAFQEKVHAAALAMSTGATFAATAAQYGLNAALLACPITWIVVGVIALVAGIIALCNWIAKTTGVAATGFGVITGGINVAIQAVWNAMLVVANVAIGIWNALGACCSNIGTAFHNVISNVQGWFYGLLSTALTVVEGICAALNKLPFVEFDYSGISAKADEYAAKSAEAYGSVEEYQNIGDAFTKGYNTFDTFTDGWASDAFKAGASWGDGVADKVSSFFDFGGGGTDLGSGFDLSSIADNTGLTADNTGKTTDALAVTEEQLEYLRDIAERDAINRFTTAEVKIDMTGMTNRIDGSADLDGVISQLTEGFTEALVTAAEGVHA